MLNKIKDQRLLSISDYNKPFELNTNSLTKAIGGILYQDGKVIGFRKS